MNKNKTSDQQNIWNYLLTVVVSAAMGAALTWLFMSQRSTSVIRPMSQPTPSTITNTTAPDVSGMSASEAAVTLGNFAYDHQQWPEAIRHYQDAIASGRDDPDVRTDLGNALRFSGQLQQALAQDRKSTRLNSSHSGESRMPSSA